MRNCVVIVVVAVALAGCAFGTRNVNLAYEPVTPSVAPGSKGTVAVAKFSDTRTSESGTNKKVGRVRNGFGMTTAEVKATQDPVVWVSDSLARALEAEGYRVERVTSGGSVGDLTVVSGAVAAVEVDMYMSIGSEIRAKVNVDREGQRVVSTECMGEASAVAWTGSANEYQESLSESMKSFIADCVPKLTPHLGSGA